MALGAWLPTNTTLASLLNGTFNIESDSFKCALFLSTSNLGATSTTFAGVTNEHAANFGYTAGGIAVDLGVTGTTTAKADIATDPIWTADGGNLVAKWACIYKVAGNVLCYCLLDSTGANVTVTDGYTLTVAADTLGIFDLTVSA
jgi:hypothetical protein